MQLQSYPRCCGICIITDFPYNKTGVEKELIKLLKLATRHRNSNGQIFNYGMVQVALTADQLTLHRDVLKKHGFKTLRRFTNPKTGRVVTVMSLLITKKY